MNYILSPDLRALAEVYGRMIGEHAKSIDLDHEPDALRQVVLKWLPPTGETAPPALTELASPGLIARHASKRVIGRPRCKDPAESQAGYARQRTAISEANNGRSS